METVIRKAVAGEEHEIVCVNVAAWQTSLRGIVADDFLNSLSADNTKMYGNLMQDVLDGRCVVAVKDGKIIGFCSFGAARDNDFAQSGEIYFFYLLKEFQKQGIGRKIYQKAKDILADLGYQSLIIECLSNNPSCSFYAALGGEKVKEYDDEMGGSIYRNSLFYFEI